MFGKFPLLDGVVYGPVRSRRLGMSLGINILPFGVKVCSFNCVYCQCGRSGDGEARPRHEFPSARDVGGELRRSLLELKKAGTKLDGLTLSGNGEPTLHPDFPNVVRAVLSERNAAAPGVPVNVFSNGTLLSRAGVAEGMNLADARHVKLDAGKDELFRKVNAPLRPVRVKNVLEGLARLRDFVIQSMFIRGRNDNTGGDAVEAWIDAIGRAKPKAVHLYSLDRAPADPAVLQADRETLEKIAARLGERTGIPAEVF